MDRFAERPPVLYSFRRCPYAIRARLALRYAGLEYELREVDLGNKLPEMLDASPKGTVPVLVIGEGSPAQEVIEESLDIMFWALAQSDPDGWLEADRDDASKLIDGNDYEFKPWLDRYKYPDRFDGVEPGEPLAHCERFLADLERRLEQSAYLCGEHVSIADMALYSFVRQFAFVDIERFRASSCRSLIRWLDEFLASQLFAAVMQKYPVWNKGDAVTVF